MPNVGSPVDSQDSKPPVSPDYGTIDYSIKKQAISELLGKEGEKDLVLKPIKKISTSDTNKTLKEASKKTKENSEESERLFKKNNRKSSDTNQKNDRTSDSVSAFETSPKTQEFSKKPQAQKPDVFSGMKVKVQEQGQKAAQKELTKAGINKEQLNQLSKILQKTTLPNAGIKIIETFKPLADPAKSLPYKISNYSPSPDSKKPRPSSPQGKTSQAKTKQQEAQNFAQRRQVRQQLQEKIAEQMQQQETQGQKSLMAQARGEKPSAQAQAEMRGMMAFIKEQDQKTRLFQLMKDVKGKDLVLAEQHATSESNHPQATKNLSPQVEARLKRMILRYQQNPNRRQLSAKPERLLPDPSEIEDPKLAKEVAKLQAYLKGDESSGADLELDTRFLLKLWSSLEGDHKAGKKLGEAEDPNFPGKENWISIFANMAQAGNFAKPGKKSLDVILSLLFRGIHTKGKQHYLIGDILYNGGKRAKAIKLAQMLLGEDQILAWLASLQPGQIIPAHQLRQLFGEELDYIEMAHGDPVTEEALANENETSTLNNPESRERFALALAAMRRGENNKEIDNSLEQIKVQTQMQKVVPGFWTRFSNQFNFDNLIKDLPRLYTALSYIGLAGALLGITIFLILKLNNS